MITVTWHLLLMIVISVILVMAFFREREGLDFSFVFYGVIFIIIWLSYGGVFIW